MIKKIKSLRKNVELKAFSTLLGISAVKYFPPMYIANVENPLNKRLVFIPSINNSNIRYNY